MNTEPDTEPQAAGEFSRRLMKMLVAAALVFPLGAFSAEDEGQIDEEQAQEREHAQKLRRAREELELRQAEAARKRAAEQLRQREMSRLQGIVSGAGRRESFLSHDVYWAQRERGSISRDPADHSAMARRSNLDHQMYHLRNERERADTLRQRGTNQLNGLRLR